jgi:drug/metabolite transporter (DMT)-like permease
LRSTSGVPWLGRRDVGVVFLQALTGVFGFSVFWLYGLRQTTAGEAGIVAAATPAGIALASFALLRERPGRRQLAGIALAVLGVASMTALGQASGASRGPNPLVGNFLILGAVVGEALFLVLGKRAGARLPPLVISTGVTVAGFLLFLPPAISEATAVDLAAVPLGAWLAVAYYAIGPTVLGYVLVYQGLARVPASAAAAFTGVVPVTAVLLAALFLGEPIGWPLLLGLVGVLAAIALTVAEDGSARRRVNG